MKNDKNKNKVVLTFKELSSKDVGIAGGKGASLGEMTQAGIPVPPGFVILSTAFEKFLGEADLNVEIDVILDSVNHKEVDTVENASEKIQALILRAEIPKNITDEIQKFFKNLATKYVAIRSSATAEDSASAAWAGQLESYLNTTEENLLENVKKCWASLFTPRAIVYRFEKELHKQKISVAVVVQKMVESKISGIAFSVHPVTRDKNQLIIEAGLGLGEAIVSGQIIPDSYVIEKEPRRIIDKNIQVQTRGLYRSEGGGNEWRTIPKEIGEKQVLTDEQILNLAKIIIDIENHYGFPCDIEWAICDNNFYILQSRPITTLTSSKKHTSPTYIDGTEWELSATRNLSALISSINSMGHYRYSSAFGINMELRILNLIHRGREVTMFLAKEEIEKYNQEVWKTGKEIAALRNKYEKYVNELFHSVDKIKKEFSLANWCNFAEKFMRLCAGLHLTLILGRIGSIKLQDRLAQLGYKEKIPLILGRITYPEEHTPLSQSHIDLCKIGMEKGSKEILLKEWLENYQHIPVNWIDEPWTMEDALSQLKEIKEPEKEYDRLTKVHSEKIKLAKEELEKIKNEEINELAKIMAVCTGLNEYRKNAFSKSILEIRPVLKKIANILGRKNYQDLYYFTFEELTKAIEGKMSKEEVGELISSREIVGFYPKESGLEMLTGEQASALFEYVKNKPKIKKIDSGEIISGLAANPGKIIGMAKVVFGSHDFKKFNSGEILVAKMTSVDYVPLLSKAAAFVTDEGGITCHAAIVSREMDKPCIVGTKIATQIIRDGDRIEVDADRGIVSILE